MKNLADLTTGQLRRVIAIKEQIQALQGMLELIAGEKNGDEAPGSSPVKAPIAIRRKYRMTAAHKRKTIIAPLQATKMLRGKAKPRGREMEAREMGRGLLEHLDEIGSTQGHAQLIEFLMRFRLPYQEDSEVQDLRGEIRYPSHADTMPDWLDRTREQFSILGGAIYAFADRHRDRVLRRHERKANINGLSNFISVLIATTRVLFVYLRRGVLTQAQVLARLRDYLNTFTGTIPQYRDEDATGYLARIYSNGNGNPDQLGRIFEEYNVSGHLHALLLIAQVARATENGSDPSIAGNQLPMLVDQIKAFENNIGLGSATEAKIGKALEMYEMLTKEELALWVKTRSEGGSGAESKIGQLQVTGGGQSSQNPTQQSDNQSLASQSGQSDDVAAVCMATPPVEAVKSWLRE